MAHHLALPGSPCTLARTGPEVSASASRIFVCFCSRWLPSPGVVARLIPQTTTAASLTPTWRSDGVMRAFRFVGAYKRAAAHSRARGKTASMPALVCVYLIASDAHEPRALTPFLSQVFLTRCTCDARIRSVASRKERIVCTCTHHPPRRLGAIEAGSTQTRPRPHDPS